MIRLVIGGIKSGKTAYGLEKAIADAKKMSIPLTMIATSYYDNNDTEMVKKIKSHQEERLSYQYPIDVIEEQCDIVNYLDHNKVYFIDCMTLWLNNIIYYQYNINKNISNLCNKLQSLNDVDITIITNELGLSPIAENAQTREFCNYHGIMNQMLAKISDNAYTIIAGLPLQLK